MSTPMKPTPPAVSSGVALPHSQRGFKGYFKDVQREIKKIDWPSKEDTTRLTGIVLVVVLMLMGILLAFGFIVEQAIDRVIGKVGV